MKHPYMICDVCKTDPATFYLTKIVDGELKKMNVCENCSKDPEVSEPVGFEALLPKDEEPSD